MLESSGKLINSGICNKANQLTLQSYILTPGSLQDEAENQVQGHEGHEAGGPTFYTNAVS